MSWSPARSCWFQPFRSSHHTSTSTTPQGERGIYALCTPIVSLVTAVGEGRWSRPFGQRVSVPSVLRYQPTPHVLVASPCADVLLRTRKVASHLLLHVLKLFSKITLVPTSCCMVAKITRIPIGGDKSRLFPSIVACSPKLRLFPPSVDYI